MPLLEKIRDHDGYQEENSHVLSVGGVLNADKADSTYL